MFKNYLLETKAYKKSYVFEENKCILEICICLYLSIYLITEIRVSVNTFNLRLDRNT